MSAERLTGWWVDRYTRGLDPRLREARRAELASDVWEHRTAAGDGLATELAIASRCLRGVPADLVWRRAARGGRRALPTRSAIVRGVGWAVAGMAYAFLAVMHGWFATALVGLDLYGADSAPGDVEHWSRMSGALLAMLVGGALLLRRCPRLGAGLVVGAGAAFVTAGLMWWFIPVLGPTAIAVTVASITLARRRRARDRATDVV
ncbi:MAG: hypothetical protein ACRC50_07375 [Gaiella sp.]